MKSSKVGFLFLIAGFVQFSSPFPKLLALEERLDTAFNFQTFLNFHHFLRS